MIEINVKTSYRQQMIDITGDLDRVVKNSGVEDGVVVIFNPHTTGAVTINEGADPAVREDILEILSKQYPVSSKYRHMEGNSDAHIKAAIIGSDRTVILKDRKLVLGTWQKVFFCEFDGPRTRKIYIKIIPG